MNNIVIAQEVIHTMRIKKGKMGWMVVKVDLEKAFDRHSWKFIENTLEDAGLLEKRDSYGGRWKKKENQHCWDGEGFANQKKGGLRDETNE